ncbi:hypothetical protein HK102_005055 [Quaeritorhiza haematococci]|nr:hypothetical protein HK102_005055 [Quaeritorhiza haematococci]
MTSVKGDCFKPTIHIDDHGILDSMEGRHAKNHVLYPVVENCVWRIAPDVPFTTLTLSFRFLEFDYYTDIIQVCVPSVVDAELKLMVEENENSPNPLPIQLAKATTEEATEDAITCLNIIYPLPITLEFHGQNLTDEGLTVRYMTDGWYDYYGLEFIEAIDYSYNHINSSLDQWFNQPVQRFTDLYLDHNKISGPLNVIGRMVGLAILSLSHNRLNSDFHEDIWRNAGYLTEVRAVDAGLMGFVPDLFEFFEEGGVELEENR